MLEDGEEEGAEEEFLGEWALEREKKRRGSE